MPKPSAALDPVVKQLAQQRDPLAELNQLATRDEHLLTLA
jgi:hypothetical protein